MIDKLPQRKHALDKRTCLAFQQILDVTPDIVDIVDVSRHMVKTGLARRPAHEFSAVGKDSVLQLRRPFWRAEMLRIAAWDRICRRIHINVVRPPDAKCGHLAHLVGQPPFPCAPLAHQIALTASPKSALVERTIRELAYPILVPFAGTHVTIRVCGMKSKLKTKSLGPFDQPPVRLLSAGLGTDGEMSRNAPVIAAVLPTRRTDRKLVNARILQRLKELLRHAKWHVHRYRRLFADLVERLLVRNRFRRMGLDTHDDRVAQVVKLRIEPVLYRVYRPMIKLVFPVCAGNAVVIRLRAIQTVEVYHNVIIVVSEESAYLIAPEPRICLIFAILSHRHEIVVEAPCLHVCIPHRAAFLHGIDRHHLARGYYTPGRLVEKPVVAASFQPVAVIVLAGFHERRNDLHARRIGGNLALRHGHTEVGGVRTHHIYGS